MLSINVVIGQSQSVETNSSYPDNSEDVRGRSGLSARRGSLVERKLLTMKLFDNENYDGLSQCLNDFWVGTTCRWIFKIRWIECGFDLHSNHMGTVEQKRR